MPYDEEPPKVWIANIETGKTVQAQGNPPSFGGELEVEYADHKVPGLGFRPLQYQGTGNQRFDIELLFVAETIADKEELDHASRFIHSLCYRWRGKSAPPHALFVWPGEVTLEMVVKRVKSESTRFNKQARTTQLTMVIELEEARDEDVFGDDVLRDGFNRSAKRGIL